jgi:hypothetical protein
MIPLMAKCLRRVEDSEARVALVWMLGEFGHEIVEVNV